jgi:hypothetical protein
LAIAFKPATTTAPLNMVNLKTKHPASTDWELQLQKLFVAKKNKLQASEQSWDLKGHRFDAPGLQTTVFVWNSTQEVDLERRLGLGPSRKSSKWQRSVLLSSQDTCPHLTEGVACQFPALCMWAGCLTSLFQNNSEGKVR